MNKSKVVRGGRISMQLPTNINEIPQTQPSEPVVVISAPPSVSNSDHNLEEISIQSLTEDIELPISAQDISLMPKEAQVVIDKEIADILAADELEKQDVIVGAFDQKETIDNDMVITSEHKETIHIEMCAEVEEQVIRDTFMVDTEENKAASIVSRKGEDILKVIRSCFNLVPLH